MTAKVFKSAQVALVGVLVTLCSSCAEERYYAAEVSEPNDSVVYVTGEITMEANLYHEVTSQSELTTASANFDQTVIYNIINSFDAENEFSDTKEQNASVLINLKEDTIEVEELTLPEIASTFTSTLDSTSNYTKRVFSFNETDSLSDGQTSNINANYIAYLVNVNGQSVKLPHISVDSIKLSEIKGEQIDKTLKVTMHYEVYYTEDSTAKMLKVYPFYYQVVKTSEPVLDQVGDPYLYADTIMSYFPQSVVCEVTVFEVTPHTLAPNDTIMKDFNIFEIVNVGKPGKETLHVESAVPTVTYTKEDCEDLSRSNGKFSYYTDVTKHNWTATFDNNSVIKHVDNIYLRVTDFEYNADMVSFKYDINAEIEVIEDEVVNLPEMEGTEHYLGTRVFTIGVKVNGYEFTRLTGQTHLIKEQY